MKYTLQSILPRVLLLIAVGITTIVPTPLFASIPAVYTNDNWHTSTHDKPQWFTQVGPGSFVGATETGKSFRQYAVVLDPSIKLHRFEIDDAFFYISDRGIIWATDHLSALSIYVSRGE
jgi:hypothetical protein